MSQNLCQEKDHSSQQIRFICLEKSCSEPQKLGCVMCFSSYHQNHEKIPLTDFKQRLSLKINQKLQDFEETQKEEEFWIHFEVEQTLQQNKEFQEFKKSIKIQTKLLAKSLKWANLAEENIKYIQLYIQNQSISIEALQNIFSSQDLSKLTRNDIVFMLSRIEKSEENKENDTFEHSPTELERFQIILSNRAHRISKYKENILKSLQHLQQDLIETEIKLKNLLSVSFSNLTEVCEFDNDYQKKTFITSKLQLCIPKRPQFYRPFYFQPRTFKFPLKRKKLETPSQDSQCC